MGRNWFAQTGVVRMPLSGDHWVEFKEELSVGDVQAQHFMVIRSEDGKTSTRQDNAMVGDLAVALVGWSLEDEQGPVKLGATPDERAEQLRALTLDGLLELRTAYTAHYKSATADEKKEPTPTTIEPS